MGFSRQEYWSGLPFPSPGDLPDPGIEPRSPALEADALTSEPTKLKTKIWVEMQKQQWLNEKDFNFCPFSNSSFCYSPFGQEKKNLHWDFSTMALSTVRARSLFGVRPILCILGCSAASLVSTHWMPWAYPLQVWQSKMTPGIVKCTLNTVQIKVDIYNQSYLVLGSGWGGVKITQLTTTVPQ